MARPYSSTRGHLWALPHAKFIQATMRLKAASVSAIALASSLFVTSASAVMANSAEVYLKADAGSWVGGAIGGPTADWVHGVDGVFYGYPNYGNFLRGVEIGYTGDATWTFEFAAPSYNRKTNTNDGQLLQVGLYKNAERFPFNSPTKPGIDISGNGRGNNTESGWFEVLQISYDTSGNLDQFAVDFKQFDEGNTTVGLYGSLRFNSDIPIDTSFTPSAVPEPDTIFMMIVAGTAFAARRRLVGRKAV